MNLGLGHHSLLVLLLIGIGALPLGSGVASAAPFTIDFNAVPSSGNPSRTTLTTDGFTFTSALFFHTIDSPGLCAFGGCVSNGTVYIAVDPPLGSPITMTRSAGGTFSLVGFDGAKLFNDDAAAASAGFQNGVDLRAESPTRIFDVGLHAPGFESFVVDPRVGFDNVTSITFGGIPPNALFFSFALDNIVVDVVPEPTVVPEPASLLLFATTAAGLALASWTRRKPAWAYKPLVNPADGDGVVCAPSP